MKLTAMFVTASAAFGLTALSTVAVIQPSTGAELKHYESNTKDFWLHPPDDWFMGDENEALTGTNVAARMGPPTGLSASEIEANLKNIKLAPNFKISLYAPDVLSARQMAWGDDGTLFVGSFSVGTVYAIVDRGGQKQVKTVLKGLKKHG